MILTTYARKKTLDYFFELIEEYVDLVEKLENPEKQNWYFRKGTKSKIDRVNELKNQYLQYQKKVNNHSLENLNKILSEKKQALKKIKKTCTNETGFFPRLGINSIETEISRLKSYIYLKKLFPKLPDIDFFLKDKSLLDVLKFRYPR